MTSNGDHLVGTRRWRTLRRHILERDRGICWICHQPGATTVDHKTPRRHGGNNDPANLAAAHARCNYGRRDRPPNTLTTSRAW